MSKEVLVVDNKVTVDVTAGIVLPTEENLGAIGVLPSLLSGKVRVTSSSGSSQFECVADGVADDRPILLEALTYAAANMPCVVELGEGDYGISGGIEVKPPQGARGLIICGAGATATRIRFNKGSALVGTQFIAFAIAPSVTPTVGAFSTYLQDITVDGIGFYDDDPAAHEGGTGEESHGVKIQYAVNARINECHGNSIGDECFDLNFVSQGYITNNTTINTPSFGSGSALNVQFCQSVLIDGNVCHGSDTQGVISTVTGSSGVGIENVDVALPDDMKYITVTNNILRDFDGAAISPNNADSATVMTHCDMSHNTIDNCGTGILLLGSNLHQFYKVIGNTITNTTDGILFNVANTLDSIISNNVIDTCSNRGILCNGTRIALSGNNISNTAAAAIYISSALDVQINGGIIDSCGGIGTPTIQAIVDGKEVTIDGAQILNTNSTTQVILSCERIRNVRIEGGTPYIGAIWSANEVTNCTLNGGINLDGATYGSGRISGNRIDAGGADLGGVAITLASTNDACIVTDNYINTFHSGTHRTCINVASGSDNHVITGNITIADAPANGIVDAGTGNIVANNQEL